jgi:hypothetical protein
MGQIKRREPESPRISRHPGLSGHRLIVHANPGDDDMKPDRSIKAEILHSLRKTAYTVFETASVGRTTLYAHANAGSLHLTKVGTKTIVLATDLAAWLALLRSGAG